ncbi:ABC transporter substrate-binding protein [Brevibacillus sp. NRS-1366]|uniref:ABC transporter substrate-binding protein n=1 Tax=Brevibacillus sp. NRS-1366 TaxID=3233899 RepID=UPI003D203BAE
MLKKSLLLIILLVSSIISVACGNMNTQDNENQKSNSESSELVIVGWGGPTTDAKREAFYKPFEKKYNVKVREVAPVNYGKLKSMVESGNVEWDVVDVDTDFVYRGSREGLLEPLDYSVISKEDIMPELIHEYGIGSFLYDVPIAYSSKFKDNPPKNWVDFWDAEKFPGKRSLQKNPVGVMEQALLADGVKPEELYPLDINRAFKSLDKIRDHVNVWWSQGTQPLLLLVGNEVSMSSGWNGTLAPKVKEGAPIGIQYNQSNLMSDSWVVPKGSKNKELAMKFIAFATEPDQQAKFIEIMPHLPVNTKSLDLISKEKKHEKNFNNKVLINFEWWDKNFDEVNERFQKWLIK